MGLFDRRPKAEQVRARQDDPGALTIQMGTDEVDLASAVMLAESDGGKVHVAVWHPKFPDLPDGVRGQITFLLLDALLGEEAVETYVGEIRWAPPDGGSAAPLTELPARVAALRRAAPDGEPG